MKKILGISLVAMMAVTTARADIASKAYVTVDQSGTYKNINKAATPGVQIAQLDAAIGQLPEGKSAAEAISAAGSNVKSVKVNNTGLEPDANGAVNVTVAEGATNGTVAVNGTDVAVHGLGSAAFTESSAYDAAGTAASAAASAVNALDATPSQTAADANGQLALSLTEVDGVVTAISGSITPNTYDAYGAAGTAAGAVETKLAAGASGYDINAKSIQIKGKDVKAFSAGTNVSFGEADADGVVPINSTYTYSLPVATSSVLGGVKDGNYVTIGNDGTISADVATTAAKGVVQVGTNIAVSDGTISVATATGSAKGVMQVGTDLSVADGVVSVDKSTTVASTDNKPVSSAAVYTALHNFVGGTTNVSEVGTYVLTAEVDNSGVATYHWEAISRPGGSN